MNDLHKPIVLNDNFLTERILEFSSDLITLHTQDGEIVYASPATSLLLGYKPEELAGKSPMEFFHPLDGKRIAAQAPEYYFHKYISFRIRRKEGDYIWLETILQPMDDISNGEQLLLGISRDITARKIAETELNETIEKYRQLVEHSHDTIGLMTKEGTFTYINETGKKLIGATSTTEIIGTTIYDFTPTRDHEKIKNFIVNNGLYKDASGFIETSLIRLDKEIRQIDMKLISTIHQSQKGKQVIIRDITERRLTEEKLQQAEKLSVVGHLAAGIAHEIRNPLTAIKGFTQLMREERNSSYIDVMMSELERIDKIVSDLLILAKPQIKHYNATNVSKLVQDIVSLLNTQAILKNIELTIKFEDKNITIDCEEDKIKQVFINIIKNAIEATDANGKIRIHCSKKDTTVQFMIRDNGTGIPKERLPNLGEPFYSTKEKGTGLGLMICKKIIKDHNGSLQIRSRENEGTIVTIALPIYQKKQYHSV